ncbi:MAG: IS66 family transposase [Oligoflexales bacterium]
MICLKKLNVLKERVESLVRSKFESKAERQLRDLLERTQKSLFDDNQLPPSADTPEKTIEDDQNKKSRKTSGGRKPLPSDIERHETFLDVDHQNCTACGSEKPLRSVSKKISGKVHITPAKVSIEVTVRPVYSCGSCESMAIAALPPHPIPKVGITIEGLATIATMKYANGLPLNRVSNLLSRGGLTVDREKLAYWMIKISKVLEPLVERYDELQRDGPLMQIDETRFQVLKEPGRTSEAKSWMIAAVSLHRKRGNIIRFHYSPSRSTEVIKGLIGAYDGLLVTDGLSVYHAVEEASEIALHGGCWSHCRLKFFDAAKSSTKVVYVVVWLKIL